MTAKTQDFRAAFDHPHRLVDVPGGRLAYWRFGSGPDVVAVHGWPLHSATFRRVLPHLTGSFRVHLFDLPGTGKTEWAAPGGFEANAAALRRGIEAVGLREYGLLAHDSGGVMARLVAAGNAQVRGLVLAGSEIPGHHSKLLAAYALAAKLPGMGRLLGATMQVPFIRRSPLAFGTCFTDARYADGEFGDLFARPLRRAKVTEGHMMLMRAFTFDFVDSLAEVHRRIKAPTLCIWGENDPFFPVAKARAMLPEFGGGAELAVIAGAKLFPHEDHPEEFVALARPFLAAKLEPTAIRAA